MTSEKIIWETSKSFFTRFWKLYFQKMQKTLCFIQLFLEIAQITPHNTFRCRRPQFLGNAMEWHDPMLERMLCHVHDSDKNPNLTQDFFFAVLCGGRAQPYKKRVLSYTHPCTVSSKANRTHHPEKVQNTCGNAARYERAILAIVQEDCGTLAAIFARILARWPLTLATFCFAIC